jgi:hypothetical protein
MELGNSKSKSPSPKSPSPKSPVQPWVKYGMTRAEFEQKIFKPTKPSKNPYKSLNRAKKEGGRKKRRTAKRLFSRSSRKNQRKTMKKQ